MSGMNVSVTDVAHWAVWRPGAALEGPKIALSIETEGRMDGTVPAPVLASATDGRRGFFVLPRHLAPFIARHIGACCLIHDAAFVLAVLAESGVDVVTWIESGRIFDVGILYRLLQLADVGTCRGEWSLEHLAQQLLGIYLPSNAAAPDGSDPGTSLGRLLDSHESPDDREFLNSLHGAYLDHAARRPVVIQSVAAVLDARAKRLFGAGLYIFDRATYRLVESYDDYDLADAWAKHGFLTHDIQLKASIALAAIERRGLHVDTQLARCLSEKLEAEREERLVQARGAKERRFSEVGHAHRTLIQRLAQAGRVVRGRFNLLVDSGRTSCSGRPGEGGRRSGVSLQNLPRSRGICECLVPSPGYLFLSIDYGSIELVALAQHCETRYGRSRMAAALRNGADLHALYALRRQGIHVEPTCRWDKHTLVHLLGPHAVELRRRSKSVNFGFASGLGTRGLIRYARGSYGIEMTETEAKAEKEFLLQCWPEMRRYLAPEDVEFLCRRFPHHWRTYPRRGASPNAESILPAIYVFRGILQGHNETSTTRRRYGQDEVEWAWRTARSIAEESPHVSGPDRGELIRRIDERNAGIDLWEHLVPRPQFVSTLTGRMRRYPGYCSARNYAFQGLAADGAKLAMYRLHREGFRVVNFIHDEFLIEIQEHDDDFAIARRIQCILIEEMRTVVPDIPVTCEYALMPRWYRQAEAVFDLAGERGNTQYWAERGYDEARLADEGAVLVPWTPDCLVFDPVE